MFANASVCAEKEDSLLHHYDHLDIDSSPEYPRLTKIVCTIGKSSYEII